MSNETDDGAPDATLKLKTEDVDWLRVEDEIVALHSGKSLYLGTNPSGALLWEALAEGTTERQLIDLLTDTYGVDSEQAQRDVSVFLDSVREHELLS